MTVAAEQTYQEFLASKRLVAPQVGPAVADLSVHPSLFPFQAALVRWAVRKGRCALFADTGLGKTRCQLEWARLLGERTLILAPLGVARQTVREGAAIDLDVTYARSQEQVSGAITVTNYDMLDHFDTAAFGAVVLDESSLLKAIAGKTRARLTALFANTPYRLCCTATPAPNDIAEIANHSEFLGVMRRVDMLASFFVHDECFVAETPIDTIDGPKPIGAMRMGDRLLNASGVDEVVRTSTKQVSCLIEIMYNGKQVLCSANHPWFTARGWVAARDLREGDELVSQAAALRMVRERVHGASEKGRTQRSLLQSVLLGEMADEQTGLCSKPGHARKETEAFGRNGGLLCFTQPGCGGAQGASASIEAHAASWGAREGERLLETGGVSTSSAGWQRSRSDTPAGHAVGVVGHWMGSRGHDFLGQADHGLSELLPRGLVASSTDDDCGGRRSIPRENQGQGAGPQKGCIPDVIRVDRVALHESGSALFEQHSGGGDTVTLHDLTLSNHPSFSVHGALVHNSGWRLKGHAHEPFYRWLASWGMVVRMPSDIGYPDDGYVLPALTVEPLWVESGYVPDGALFFTQLKGIEDRAAVRRGTMSERVRAAAGLVNADGEPWICWCGLNDESSALAAAIPGAVEIVGAETGESKSRKIDDFGQGRYRVLVTKPSVAGFGVNFQHCARMVFVGLSDSWESYYQCIRRCYRFGQQHPVHAYVVLSQMEDAIYHNVKRKEEEAQRMRTAVLEHVRDFEREELEAAAVERWECEQDEATGEGWRLLLGDSVERLGELATESIDLTVTSPPFQALYTYNPTVRDVGNARSVEEFGRHFGFIIDHLLRVTKPGRHCCIHVAQVPAMLERDGYIGLKDFRGDVVRLFCERGFIYHGEVCIDKDPQVQAIRTKSKGLLFVQMRKDATWSRPALADYILIFRKPGENAVPVHPDISNEQWILWARPVWYDIAETDTLQYTTARDADDERHICPLQLGTIERCIRLWSNTGETVLDPFAGIASVPYVALAQGRQAVGIELKRSYYAVGTKNVRGAEEARHRPTLFDGLDGWSSASRTGGVAR